MNEPGKEILAYLEHSYSGAKMADDLDTMTRIARAIEVFKADTALEANEVFAESFLEKVYSS